MMRRITALEIEIGQALESIFKYYFMNLVIHAGIALCGLMEFMYSISGLGREFVFRTSVCS